MSQQSLCKVNAITNRHKPIPGDARSGGNTPSTTPYRRHKSGWSCKITAFWHQMSYILRVSSHLDRHRIRSLKSQSHERQRHRTSPENRKPCLPLQIRHANSWPPSRRQRLRCLPIRIKVVRSRLVPESCFMYDTSG